MISAAQPSQNAATNSVGLLAQSDLGNQGSTLCACGSADYVRVGEQLSSDRPLWMVATERIHSREWHMVCAVTKLEMGSSVLLQPCISFIIGGLVRYLDSRPTP